MNATHWHTLTDFVAHLGRTGVCRVDETEAGLHITLVAGDAAKEAAAAARERRDKAERDDTARAAAAVAAQAARAAEAAAAAAAPAPAPSHDLVRGEGDAPVRLAVSRGVPARAVAPAAAAFGEDDDDSATATATAAAKRGRPTKAEELIARETAAKRARQQEEAEKEVAAAATAPPPWIRPRLTVKLVASSLRASGLYKAKAIVTSVDGHTATVETVEGGAVLRVDEAHAETVLPGVGGSVMVVRGRRARATGTLSAIDAARFRARVVALDDGGGDGWFEYDDVCKWRKG